MKKGLKKGIVIFLDICILMGLFTAYGPFKGFQDWFVTTAMSTSNHKYLAYILYSQDSIDTILDRNTITAVEQQSNEDLISFTSTTYDDSLTDLEKEILDRENNEEYKIIEINGNGYTGWITVIYDPTRLSLVTADSDSGDTVSEMAEDNDALVAINGGGFEKGRGSRSSMGGLIADSVVLTDSEETEDLICMTTDGKLLLKNSTVQQLNSEYDIAWAVHFSPFLIANGVSSEASGNAGGQHPRTAIGQRSDGIVIFLTIDGRGSNGSMGVNFAEMISIFEECGCINAANLDGGGSTTLYANGQLINDPSSGSRSSDERKVYDAIIYS